MYITIYCTFESEGGCLTSHATIFQLYMWRYIYVQADGRTYVRAPNAIDISQGSLNNVPDQAPTRGHPFYTVILRNSPFSRLLRHDGDTEDTFSIHMFQNGQPILLLWQNIQAFVPLELPKMAPFYMNITKKFLGEDPVDLPL